MAPPLAPDILDLLAGHSESADAEPRWPAESWEALRRGGALGWLIPTEFGGAGLPYPELLEGYEALAGACLTTCLILSQREGAIRRIRDSGNQSLCRELLPALARGERFTTVGLSQLTTSRQHGQPSLQARLTPEALVLNGTIPWVTGAARANFFVIGAVLEDGQQVLAVLPSDLPQVTISPPLDLMALQGSITAEIHCEHATLDRRWLLAGPAAKVLAAGRGGAGGLETSCLAAGLAGTAVAFLRREARNRLDLQNPADRLEKALQRVRAEMYRLAGAGSSPVEAATLRTHANKLVLRATQAALTAAKGTGFVRTHPAQRWARQALFFLVWSCPGPVARATLATLACDSEGDWAVD
jgi:alkylation response protein AidB-like acyl-CoA dehydrogenase